MRHFTHSKSAQWYRKRQQERLQLKQQTTRPVTPFWSTLSRIKFALIAGILGLLLGGLFDLTTAFLRTFAQPNASAEFSWFLAYVFATAGAILGFCFGARSGEFFAQIFASNDKGPNKASSELIRLIAKTLLVAGIIWSIFLIFLS